MKYITFTVPCYNSENYMKRCINSLLIGGNDVEIIIVDDGSTDRTGEIADEYAELYPGIVKVVHKENGGHGSGVNMGMKLATGYVTRTFLRGDGRDYDLACHALHGKGNLRTALHTVFVCRLLLFRHYPVCNRRAANAAVLYEPRWKKDL